MSMLRKPMCAEKEGNAMERFGTERGCPTCIDARLRECALAVAIQDSTFNAFDVALNVGVRR